MREVTTMKIPYMCAGVHQQYRVFCDDILLASSGSRSICHKLLPAIHTLKVVIPVIGRRRAESFSDTSNVSFVDKHVFF
jgi:hypothetical protein